MAVTAKLVKELRDKTGAGMMDCKKALMETDGDIDKAIDVLRDEGRQEGGPHRCRGSLHGSGLRGSEEGRCCRGQLRDRLCG